MNADLPKIPESLLQLGAKQGYVTFADISANIEPTLVDQASLEAFVTALNEMGIAVYEQAQAIATVGLLSGVEWSTNGRVEGDTSESKYVGSRCHFTFVCERRWEDLPSSEKTDSSRFCESCQLHVRLCNTPAEAAEAVAEKSCVALNFDHTTWQRR